MVFTYLKRWLLTSSKVAHTLPTLRHHRNVFQCFQWAQIIMWITFNVSQRSSYDSSDEPRNSANRSTFWAFLWRFSSIVLNLFYSFFASFFVGFLSGFAGKGKASLTSSLAAASAAFFSLARCRFLLRALKFFSTTSSACSSASSYAAAYPSIASEPSAKLRTSTCYSTSCSLPEMPRIPEIWAPPSSLLM